MAQNWTDDVFARGHTGQVDLQNMENNFAALKSLFSGASAPSNPTPGMPWFDTTKKVLKVRDSLNSAWLGLMHGDTSQKMWVYRNSAMNGWAVDSGVTDKVLAIKGGATYTTGGATAGSWIISGLSAGAHTFSVAIGSTPVAYQVTGPERGLSSGSGSTSGGSVSHDGSSRPAGAVGTLQYLDL